MADVQVDKSEDLRLDSAGIQKSSNVCGSYFYKLKEDSMDRRGFLRSASIVSAGLAFPETALLFAEGPPSSDWRTFELTTRVEITKPSGATRVWLPVPLTTNAPFFSSRRRHTRSPGDWSCSSD